MNNALPPCLPVYPTWLMLFLVALALGVDASAYAPPAAAGVYALKVSHKHQHGPAQPPAGLNEAQNQSANDGADQSPQIAPYEAAKRARRHYGGRVLNVVLEHGPSGPYYRVKLLKSGRMQVVHIDAAD